MLRRVALVAGGLVTVWFVLIIVLSFALGGHQATSTKARLGETLQATVALDDLDLALVRGHLTIDRLTARRDDVVGHLALDVQHVSCELAPLGLALFDRDCGDLRISGLQMEVSSAALFKMQRRSKSRPVHADRVIIDNASLVFMPSAFAPNLGRIEITIEHAESHATVLRTPLSWLFSLDDLRAHFALPAGIVVHVGYRNGILTAAGSLFGSSPVELPIAIPAADLAKDAHEEVQQLVRLARQIAERLVAKRAEDWLRAKLGH